MLKNCVEGETGSCSETCEMCDADGTEEVSIKVEGAINTRGEIPEAITFLEIKTERETRQEILQHTTLYAVYKNHYPATHTERDTSLHYSVTT